MAEPQQSLDQQIRFAIDNKRLLEITYLVKRRTVEPHDFDFSAAPDVVLSTPRVLFDRPYAFGAGITIANYDVRRDGQRFIMVKDESGAARLNVVLDWGSELSRLAPSTAP